MTTFRYRDWLLEADPAATQAAYELVASPTSNCACNWCRNFVAWRCRGYPADVVEVLWQCGLDPNRESDVYQQALDVEAGAVHYRWFFFFRGRLASGPQAWVLTEDEPDPVLSSSHWDLRVIDVGPTPGDFAIGFGDSAYRIKSEGKNVPELLRSGPTVQVECRARVPWTVTEAMPTRV